MDGEHDTQRHVWPSLEAVFEDKAARGLHRVGVVDVGSNSVRLVVFDGAARSPAYFYNEKVMAGLGAGLDETGRLNPEGRRRAKAAIRRFVALAEGMDMAPLEAVATAAVRRAEDGPEFVAEIEGETGLKLTVIDGEEEARLSAQGVLLGWPQGEGLVCDIGGSSMELARIEAGRVWERATSDLGPLTLTGLAGGAKGRAKTIEAGLAPLVERLGPHPHLYLVGGSWRAIARLDMHRRGYPLSVLHDYRMTPKSVRETLDHLKGRDLDTYRKEVGISSGRISLVPVAGEVLRRLMARFGVRAITVSGYGIREGLLYERMPARVRARDPLIEAARHAEMLNARMPGFGERLHDFIAPLFAESVTDPRLHRAACLLHDVSWRAHPDYRAEIVFDNATRGNLGGIDHPGRVFVGLALMHRYRNGRPGPHFEPLLGLLTEAQIREAEILGRAMRFGAMFSVAAPDRLGRLDWRPRAKRLELILPPRAVPLYGEVAEARLASLAKALQADLTVTEE
ncbi:Ppx/GppA family phosphatase [Rhodovulum sp. 12E13]|uniref:Ppx/GppA family phosphatase n=1 Tax=Rhodovulum sp. 12E13 TaxID=2203891 RepID=UPI000E1A3FE0|nr:Ppx/GppA family phosphatase [Rhodovulum sp. 12E13]RDC75375.1 Ppx/GppA family phosphatase [Rhodovulum sp. 12E13]